MSIDEIIWDDQSAIILRGESTEEEAIACAKQHLDPHGPFEIGPLELFRSWPTPCGDFDRRIEKNGSRSTRGAYLGRLIR